MVMSHRRHNHSAMLIRYLTSAWLLTCLLSATGVSGLFTGRVTRSDSTKSIDVIARLTADASPDENVDGDDPAKKLEEGAAKDAQKAAEDVPTTLPPKQEVETDGDAERAAQSAAAMTGVKPNKHGDFATFFVTFCINAGTGLICVTVFSILRLKFRYVYSGNVVNGDVPNYGAPFQVERRQHPEFGVITFDEYAELKDGKSARSESEVSIASLEENWKALEVVDEAYPRESFFGWIPASLNTDASIAANIVGLDQAMLLEFFSLACKILAAVGFPMFLCMCPMHRIYGGQGLPLDEISGIAMGNVIIKHPWMYYVHAVITNVVVVVVIHLIYKSMNLFLDLRYSWLKSMPAPRCVSVLVEGIPPEWRSDKRLHEFMSCMFHSDTIKDTYMVKKAPELEKVWQEQQAARDALEEMVNLWEKDDKDPEKRPMMNETMCVGPKVDAIKYYEDKLKDLDPKVEETRAKYSKLAEEVGGINCSTGFVSFHNKRAAAVCLNTHFTTSFSEWRCSTPPPAADVLWYDLEQPDGAARMWSSVAYGCVFILYAGFLPLVVMGTNLPKILDLGPTFQPIFEAYAPSLALMICLAFLPTILLLIFRSFYALKADTYAQNKLQIWYFFFQVFFVVLVTCIGKSLLKTFSKVARDPDRLLELMADNMPDATHFYMDYMMLQWVEQAMCFLRNVNLAKFILFRYVLGHRPSVAKELAEPEDQDYYGIGARSARFTVNFVIGITFCSLSPMIPLLAFVLFFLCRLFYGYLIVFAETKKPDLGGVFWYTQLQHMFWGVGIYSILMVSILGPSPVGRCASAMPMIIASPCVFYTLHCYHHFCTHFVWEELPFTEVCFHTPEKDYVDNGFRYIQPEFIDDKTQADLELAKKHTTQNLLKRAAQSAAPGDPTGAVLIKPHFLGANGEYIEHPLAKQKKPIHD